MWLRRWADARLYGGGVAEEGAAARLYRRCVSLWKFPSISGKCVVLPPIFPPVRLYSKVF